MRSLLKSPHSSSQHSPPRQSLCNPVPSSFPCCLEPPATWLSFCPGAEPGKAEEDAAAAQMKRALGDSKGAWPKQGLTFALKTEPRFRLCPCASSSLYLWRLGMSQGAHLLHHVALGGPWVFSCVAPSFPLAAALVQDQSISVWLTLKLSHLAVCLQPFPSPR